MPFNAIRRIGESHPRFSGSSQAEIAAAEFVLADAQLVIARGLGFDSWPKLKTHIESQPSPALSIHGLVTGNKEKEAAGEIEKLGGGCQVDEKGQVRTVSFKGPKFTDAVTEHLRGLTSLKRLYFVKTQVSDDGLQHLKGLTNLTELFLNRTQVSDDGLKHLKGLTSLRTLDVSFTQVTDAGLKHLAGLTGLRTLRLQLPRITDTGLEHLTGLIGLRKLDLRFTQVTDVGANELRNALPNCKIYR